ncbi:MAG: FAD-dependent oxidoreductase [Rhizobiales bacterium]|nr:FAD-dependent oxidoreductase [Hyphomicrobiales bacterium]
MVRCVIIGAGLAGHRAAIELRHLSPDASIVLLGAEAGLPYDRPPLSKAFLSGAASVRDIVLKDTERYEELGIVHRPSTTVVAVDRAARLVRTESGEALSYDALLIATGSRPRRLPAAMDAPGLHYIRTRDDAERLGLALKRGGDMVVIGGGFIGLEVAATARQLGANVTVIEALPRLMARGMPAFVGERVLDMHRQRGVVFALGTPVEAITRRPDSAMDIRLNDRTLTAETVVVGIGIVPNVELAERSGLGVTDGIVVDRACRTSDPHIFAAGEVTAHPSGASGERRRIESWRAASDQPLVAARSMLGIAAEYSDFPWLWSDQYDANLQTIGVPDGGARYVLKERDTSHWTLIALGEDGSACGAVALNNGRDISMMRKHLRLGGPLPASVMAEFVEVTGRARA